MDDLILSLDIKSWLVMKLPKGRTNIMDAVPLLKTLSYHLSKRYEGFLLELTPIINITNNIKEYQTNKIIDP